MQNHPDAQFLRQYAAQRAEAAFSEIVARHAGLVYSVRCARWIHLVRGIYGRRCWTAG